MNYYTSIMLKTNIKNDEMSILLDEIPSSKYELNVFYKKRIDRCQTITAVTIYAVS